MIFKKSNKIQFISTVEGLETIEECLPRPAKHFIPEWFKNIPNTNSLSVKACPSFPDYFSQGYIIPMWCDVSLKYEKEIGAWNWNSALKDFSWDIHAPSQLLDYTKTSFNGIESQFVFKANSPWKIITPPGWSVLQLPLFYHFNQEWSVLPGVTDTDIHPIINQQVLYHGNGKDVIIKKGEPFVLYIPFKRSNKIKNEIRYQTKEDEKIFKKHNLIYDGEFKPNRSYRKMQRKRDSHV